MNPQILLRLGILLSILVYTERVSAFQKPDRDQLPNLDARKTQSRDFLHKKNARAENHLREVLPNAQVDYDTVTGTPKWITSTDGFLSGKGASGRGISPKTAAAVASNEPHRATKGFLMEHSELFDHGPEVLKDAKIKRDFVTAHNGMRTVVWQQQLNDIAVFEGLLISHTTKNNELVNISSHFLPNIAKAGKAGARNPQEQNGVPGISAETAVTIAAENVGEEVALAQIKALDSSTGAEKKQKFKAAGLTGETEANLVWLPMNDHEMRLCWKIVLTSRARGEMFRVLVDAQTGEVLVRHCLTNYISNASYRVYTSDSPSPFSPGYSAPTSALPPFVQRELIVTNAFNTNASPNGWIDDGVNETRGNNVDAHLDQNADNVADTPRPQGNPFRVFDYPVYPKDNALNYTNAAVVQLFFLCNWYHDKAYELGFTEAAGNFQVNNFGRGGIGNDPVQADALDGSGYNNANFSTPADGTSGRMQMYYFTGDPNRDGDMDAEVVFHEYTHGLSNRRIGGGVGITAFQTAGMGEGWSDFYALCLLAQPGDDVNGNYAAGAYATRNYYFGIRRYPYTTDMTKNPLTFRDIDPSKASNHPGIPRNPVWGSPYSEEVHNQGEVWCVALCEVRAQLINKYGFAGNQLALRLVTDGMNLSPANPTFVQARDAIIQADQVDTAGVNANEIWAGFAKRGLGFLAIAPDVSTTIGVTESFDLPDALRISPSARFTSVGRVNGPFAPNQQTLTLTNFGTNNITCSAGPSAAWLSLSSSNGMLSAGGPSASMVVTLNPMANILPAGVYIASVHFTNVSTGVQQDRRIALYVGQQDYFTEVFSGDNDLAFQSFTFTPDGSTNYYSVCRTSAFVFPTDPTGGTSVSLTDESSAQVTISGTNLVSIYGNSNNVFFIGSNGYITFYGGDSGHDITSAAAHFSYVRISGFMTDLLPAAGQVTRKQLSDRVTVTFSNVREYYTPNTNSFQIDMFFNGVIRITYLRMDARSGVVGLSRGGGRIPDNFAESDFSSYANCGAQLSLVLPSSATEGNGVLAGQGSVGIPAPVSSNLVVNLNSSDTSELVVPATVTILAGATGATFNLTVVDDSIRDGVQQPMISASAPGFVGATRSMSIFDNESATLSVVLPASATEGDTNVQGSVTVNPAPDENILVSLASSAPSAAQPLPPFVIIPVGQTSAVFTVNARAYNYQIDNDQSATITAHVAGWADGVGSIIIHDFESRNLTVNLGYVGSEFREGMGLYSYASVGIAGTLPTDLVVTLTSDDTSEVTVQPTVTIPAGSTSVAFDLTIVDDNQLDGTQVVHVTASAPGFITGSNTLNVADNEIPLGPGYYIPEDFSSNNPATVDLVWYSSETGVTYDVYFGTNSNLSPTNFLGSTTNTSWALPTLIPFTTYYWRVDSSVLGKTTGPTLQFSTIPEATMNAVSVIEGDAGVTNAVFTMTLSPPSSQPVTVNYNINSNGEDFGSATGTLVFAPGETNKNFSVPVYGDTVYESDELYSVTAYSPDMSAYVVNYGMLTIVNDDSLAPSLSKYSYNITAENCTPNGTIDPNEVVTIEFTLVNTSPTNTTGLVINLLPTNGVTVLSSPQTLGRVDPGTFVNVSFTFMVNGACGSSFTAVLSLKDGTNDLGSLAYPFTLGTAVLITHTNSFSVPNPIVIPDSGYASPFPSTNFVSGLTGTVQKVTVTLSNLNHTFPADVGVLLVGPDRQGVGLMGNVGGGFGVTNLTLTFDSDAPTQLPTASQVVSGTYYPLYSSTLPWDVTGQTTYSYSLRGFRDINPNGAWRLFVYDDTADDSGSIAGGWTLNIVTTDGSVTYSCCDFPPTISTITNQTTLEDTPTAATPFTIADFENAPDSLVVTASSSNTNLVPNSNILLGGSGSNRVVTLTPATNQFGTTTITINVADDKATSSNSFVLTVTPVNDPPVLSAISNRTVIEGTLLTFTNAATDVESVNPVVITDFEAAANGTANGSYLFRDPASSGSTSAFLDPSPNLDTVTNNFPAGHPSTKALFVNFSFKTNAINPWLRLTTFNTTSLPNPTIPFTQMLKFDIYSDKDLKVALGLRETSTTAAIGANGGSTGSIEFLGVTGTISGTPVPPRTVLASNWTTLAFQIPSEPLAAFTGNGVLDSTSGKGVLEHVALVPAGGLGAYKVYLDNFTVVSNSVVYSLDPGAPAGATINSSTGVFIWTPSEAQGPGVYNITVRATDLGTPPLSDTKTFTVTVLETNSAPVLSAIADRTIHEGTKLTITNTAIDADLPVNTLAFSLDPIIPAGATIDPANGILNWTPSASQLGTNLFTVRVTDNGTPNLSTVKSFTVTVVPKPTLQVTAGQGTITVAWPAITGTAYRVQFKNTLNDATWVDMQPDVVATNSTAVLTITPDQSQRFYRLVLSP